MIVCPYCGYENIEGVDSCESCELSLTDHYIRVPNTAVERSLLRDAVGSLEPKSPITVSTDTKVGEVLNMLVDNSIGCILIVDQGKVAGIFSERDAVMRLNEQATQLADHPISEFMTPKPQTLLERNKVAFAVQRMDLGGYRHVPIVNDNDEPVGVISVRDILNYLTEKMAAAS